MRRESREVLEVEVGRLQSQLEAAQAAVSQAGAAAAAAERQGYDRWQAAMRQRVEVRCYNHNHKVTEYQKAW